MKRYSFRLESLLKLRKIHEDKIKFELGKLNKKKASMLQEINHSRDSLEYIFKTQEELLQNKDTPGVRSLPMGIEGNRIKISNIKENLKKLEQMIQEKLKDLADAKGQVKVLEKLKEKGMIKYNKELTKKELIKNEEEVRLWLRNKDA